MKSICIGIWRPALAPWRKREWADQRPKADWVREGRHGSGVFGIRPDYQNGGFYITMFITGPFPAPPWFPELEEAQVYFDRYLLEDGWELEEPVLLWKEE